MSLKHIFAAAACAATVLTCGPVSAADPVTYTVGTGATYRPFEFQAPNRELVGFDIDLVKAIAKEQGFKVEFINTLFGVIFESVRNGDRDMIISGITITPQRKEAVDFSYPYFAAHQLILTQKNLTVKSVADLKGKNVAVVANSAGDIACSKVFGKASSNIKRCVFAYYALQNPDKQFNMARDPSFEDQYFGIAFRKGNTELRDKVNEGLKKIIANGEYAKIYAKWFGDKTQPPKLPIPE